MNDEIMTEVHAKDATATEYGHDLNALFEEIKRGEAKLKATGAKVLAPLANPTGLPNSTLQRTRFARR